MKLTSDAKIHPQETLIDIIKQYNIDLTDIVCIKSDTDGHDYKAISSIISRLKDISPIFFWEAMIHNNKEYTESINFINKLYSYAYNKFFVFDNFGGFMTMVGMEGLKNIYEYIRNISMRLYTKTMHYIDVLACKEEDRPLCEYGIRSYNHTLRNGKSIP